MTKLTRNARLRTRLACVTALTGLVAMDLASAAELSGTVTGANGKPAAGVRVVAPDLLRSATTGPDGAFRFQNIPDGEVALQISGFGTKAVYQRVAVPKDGTGTVSLTLSPNTEIARAAALNSEPAPEHLAQKQAYLQSIKPAAGQKPNIIVILFDDLGEGDLSSYGNKLIKTPNIDSLAGRGTKLDQFYSASPVCTPSRAALLSGRYPTRAHAANHVFFPTGHPVSLIRRSQGWANALPQDEILLPEVLTRAGYTTGAFGKWHLGDTEGHLPNDFGFQQYFGILYSNDMAPETLWRNKTVDTPGDMTDQATLTERITDEAVSFITDNAKKPFFAYVPYTAPHVPHHPNPKHKGVSEGGTYGDVIEDLDTNVGRILQTVKAQGIEDNTIIVILSDNGGDTGGSVGDLRGRKGETYEGGQRVPALIYWPGVTKPQMVSEEMAMNIDLFPSILTALNIPLPKDREVDGKDIRGLLKGEQTPHQYLYYVTTWTGKYEAIRDRGYKFRDPVDNTSPLQPGGASTYGIKPSLTRLDVDNESIDVTAKHPDVRARLEAALKQKRDEAARNPRGWREAR